MSHVSCFMFQVVTGFKFMQVYVLEVVGFMNR